MNKRHSRRLVPAKHGYSRTPTYMCWSDMRQRCLLPSHQDYKNYGGRGITICRRWLTSFANFLADMGEKPKGLSLDRINNNGPYSPKNCRWATPAEQSMNSRNTNFLTFNGQTMCIKEWAGKLGMKANTLSARLYSGWSVKRSLTEPTHKEKHP